MLGLSDLLSKERLNPKYRREAFCYSTQHEFQNIVGVTPTQNAASGAAARARDKQNPLTVGNFKCIAAQKIPPLDILEASLTC